MPAAPWLRWRNDDVTGGLEENLACWTIIPLDYDVLPITMIGGLHKRRFQDAFARREARAGDHGQLHVGFWPLPPPSGSRSRSGIAWADCELHEAAAKTTTRGAGATAPAPAVQAFVPRDVPGRVHGTAEERRASCLRLYGRVVVPLAATVCVFPEDFPSDVSLSQVLRELARHEGVRLLDGRLRPALQIVTLAGGGAHRWLPHDGDDGDDDDDDDNACAGFSKTSVIRGGSSSAVWARIVQDARAVKYRREQARQWLSRGAHWMGATRNLFFAYCNPSSLATPRGLFQVARRKPFELQMFRKGVTELLQSVSARPGGCRRWSACLIASCLMVDNSCLPGAFGKPPLPCCGGGAGAGAGDGAPTDT